MVRNTVAMLLIALASAGCDVTVRFELREHKEPAVQPSQARQPARAVKAAHKRPTKGPVELK